MGTEVRERDFPFTLTRSTAAGDDDGLTFEGYAAVFNSPAQIVDRDGEYDEVIVPGAFKKVISNGNPALLFNHGKHPLIGNMPLGTITELREDARGLFVKARLTDNWLIAPVRDAIADGAITGMSFRYEAVREQWTGKPSLKCRYGELHTVKEVRMPECGPVVFPAFTDTTASVRSALGELEKVEGLNVSLSVRDTVTVSTEDVTVLQMIKEAVKDRWGLDGADDVYTVDFYDDDSKLVFFVSGKQMSDHPGLWQVSYTHTDDGVTLSADPVAVQAVSYEPRSSSKDDHMKTRSDVTFWTITRAVEAEIATLIGTDGGVTSDLWIDDISDSWAVFSVWDDLEEKWPGYWKVEYTIADDLAVTLGDPVRVETAYVPVSEPPARCTDLRKSATRNTGTSTDAAPSGTSTDAAATTERAPRAPMTTSAEREAFLRETELRRRGIKAGV